jgi:hypothetical protein
MSRSPRRRGAKPAAARPAPGKQANRGYKIRDVVASAGKARFVAFLAVPVLAIVLIMGASDDVRAQADIIGQVLGSVLAAVVTAVLSSNRPRKRHS